MASPATAATVEKELGPAATTTAAPSVNSLKDDVDEEIDDTHSSSSAFTTRPGDDSEAVLEGGEALGPVLSRMVTGRSLIVPRHKRRGLLASLAVVPEISNPYEYARITKKMITLTVAIAAAAAPMASAILFPALGQISLELGANQTTTNLSVALYMLGMAIFPLWWSSFGERIGYRSIYLISFSLYVVSNICCAVSVNIGMFIAFRVASGACAASAQTIGAGTISSIWEVRERGRAMGYFYLGPLMGPLLAPIIGGALADRMGWRSTLWFLAIFGTAIVAGIIFILPETFRQPKDNRPIPAMVVDEEKELDLEAGGNGLHRTLSRVSTRTKARASQWIITAKILLVDPLRSLVFMKFPPVMITVYWAGLAFGALYILNVSIQKTFAGPPYNFSTVIIGLLYIPNSVGYLIASVAGGSWNDKIMRHAAQKRQEKQGLPKDAPLEFLPEDRMGLNAWIAGALFPLALLWYGWMVDEGVFWFVPMMATFSFGIGSMLVFSVATTMLTEFVPGRSASAVAVNNFFRNIIACVGGVVAEPLIQAIGNGWLFTIICILGLMSASVVWVMRKWGPRWRLQAQQGHYKFMQQ